MTASTAASGMPRDKSVAAIAKPTSTPPAPGRCKAYPRPNRYSAIHVTCAASTVVSCTRASRPKLASIASSAVSATARAKSLRLAVAPKGSSGWISGRRANAYIAYQSNASEEASPSAATVRKARSGAIVSAGSWNPPMAARQISQQDREEAADANADGAEPERQWPGFGHQGAMDVGDQPVDGGTEGHRVCDAEARRILRAPGVAAEEAGDRIDGAEQHRYPAWEPAGF